MINLHDGGVFPNTKVYLIHLSNEDGADRHKESRTIHIDSGTDGQYKAGDSWVYATLVIHAAEGDGQRSRPVKGGRVSVSSRHLGRGRALERHPDTDSLSAQCT